MPDSWIGLAVALLAVVPGFIASATWSRARTWKGPSSDLRTILQSLALSAAIQVLISPLTVMWIVPIRHDLADHPWSLATWFFLGVLALPVFLGIAAARVTDHIFDPTGVECDVAHAGRAFRAVAALIGTPTAPSAWDWLFTANAPYDRFVLVEFADGTRAGGAFGEGSMVLTSPEPHGVFLTQEWLIDEAGDFVAPRPGTMGLLIPSIADVRLVRVIER